MTDISKLLAEARVILEKAKVAQQESRQRGEQFNIFHACGVNHYETRHSAILAEFLNPEGSHGQGDVYLKAFLDVVPFPFQFDTSTAKVTTEFPTADGRMDVLITNAKGQAVIIENKIYAGDQWEQLKRYNTFASRQYHAGNYAILYLTLWGNEASEQSGEGVDYTRISYRDTILKWLERCIPISAQKPLIRETMIQYANHIKELTFQTMDAKNKDELIKLMIDNAEAIAEIDNTKGDYFKAIWDNHIKPKLKELATRMGFEFTESNMDCLQGGKEFTFKKPEWKTMAISFGSEIKKYNDFYYGIVSLDGKMPAQQKLNVFDDEPTDGWPYGWSYLEPPYRAWDMYTLAAIVTHPEDFVDYINIKIQNVVDELERLGIRLE